MSAEIGVLAELSALHDRVERILTEVEGYSDTKGYSELVDWLGTLKTILSCRNEPEFDDSKDTVVSALSQETSDCQQTIDKFWGKTSRPFFPRLRLSNKEGMEIFAAHLKRHSYRIEILVEKLQSSRSEVRRRQEHIFAHRTAPRPQRLSSSILKRSRYSKARYILQVFAIFAIGIITLFIYTIEKDDLGTGTGLCALIWTVSGGCHKVLNKVFPFSLQPQRLSRAMHQRTRYKISRYLIQVFAIFSVGFIVLLVYSVKKKDLGTGTGLCALIWTIGSAFREVRDRVFPTSNSRHEEYGLQEKCGMGIHGCPMGCAKAQQELIPTPTKRACCNALIQA